jgi:predicted RNA-binding protein
MINIFGEQKSVRAKIKKYNGSDSRILLEAVD